MLIIPAIMWLDLQGYRQDTLIARVEVTTLHLKQGAVAPLGTGRPTAVP